MIHEFTATVPFIVKFFLWVRKQSLHQTPDHAIIIKELLACHNTGSFEHTSQRPSLVSNHSSYEIINVHVT